MEEHNHHLGSDQPAVKPVSPQRLLGFQSTAGTFQLIGNFIPSTSIGQIGQPVQPSTSALCATSNVMNSGYRTILPRPAMPRTIAEVFRMISGHSSKHKLLLPKPTEESPVNTDRDEILIPPPDPTSNQLIMADDEEEEEEELTTTKQASPSKPRAPRAPRTKLPKELVGLMGEANMKFARGDYNECILMCQEVIRSVPNAHEPYITLSSLYEEMGDMDEAYQFGLIGCHLYPYFLENWVRIAEIAADAEKFKDAIYCYRRAIRVDKENVGLMMEVAQLELQADDKKKAAEMIERLLTTNTALSDHSLYISNCRDLAKLYHNMEQTDKARICMEKMFELFNNHITSEEVNLYAEFNIFMGDYSGTIDLLVAYCGVNISDDHRSIDVPSQLPVDLLSKLIISLAFQGHENLIKKAVRSLDSEDPEHTGDVFLDISEALTENKMCDFARPLLKRLTETRNYNLPGVWLKYGECLASLRLWNEASAAFQNVLEKVPDHTLARVQLSQAQEALGQHSQALTTLSKSIKDQRTALQDAGKDEFSEFYGKEPKLLVHTADLCKRQHKFDEHYKISRYLLFGYLPKNFSQMHEVNIIHTRQQKNKLLLLRRLLPEFDQLYKFCPAQTGEDPLTIGECWELFKNLMQTASDNKDHRLAYEMCLDALCTYCLFNESKEQCDMIEFWAIVTQIISRGESCTFDILRDQVYKLVEATEGNPLNNQYFNILSQIACFTTSDVRLARFAYRLLKKYPNSIPLNLTSGHMSIVFGSYKTAVNSYIKIYESMPDDPLLNLMIGLSYAHLVCGKYTTSRDTLTLQALCFLNKYSHLRGPTQETYYNLGRSFHQLSINSAAVHYYEKVLSTKPAIEGDSDFHLSMEAAYNLALIYNNSGCPNLAEYYLQKYCVV